MRKLTIKRWRRCNSSFKNATVYVEDQENGNVMIGQTPCTRLGDLKNGQEKSFEISESSVGIYVITDKSKNKSIFGFCPVPSGDENVFLSGELLGEVFVFDKDTAPGIIEKRKSREQNNKAIGLLISVFALFLAVYTVSLTVLYSFINSPKTFTHNGMSITLTNSFTELEYDECDFYYQSNNVIVLGTISDPYTGKLSAYEYAQALLRQNGMFGKTNVKTSDSLVYFGYDYTDKDTGVEYHYYGFVYDVDNSFWLIQFATEKEKQSEYMEDIFNWAKSVSFDE